MITIYAEEYHDDNHNNIITKQFASLDVLFDYLKKISNNFQKGYTQYNYFPTRRGRSGYDWCGRINIRNQFDSYYDSFWIFTISNENGILYSSGRTTDGQQFCAKKVEEWLERANEYVHNGERFKFVEE